MPVNTRRHVQGGAAGGAGAWPWEVRLPGLTFAHYCQLCSSPCSRGSTLPGSSFVDIFADGTATLIHVRRLIRDPDNLDDLHFGVHESMMYALNTPPVQGAQWTGIVTQASSHSSTE